jgi:hypothetical protein
MTDPSNPADMKADIEKGIRLLLKLQAGGQAVSTEMFSTLCGVHALCRIADALENIADALEKREEATSENDGLKTIYLARICQALESIQDQLPVFPPPAESQAPSKTPNIERPRCPKCSAGRLDDGQYCDCDLGRDLKTIESRKPRFDS